MFLVKLFTLIAVAFLLAPNISAQTAHYHRLQDGRTMEKGQFFAEGYFDGSYAKVPYASGGEHTSSYNDFPVDLQKMARTINVGGRFTYAVANSMSLRFGVPVRYFEQQAWRDDIPGLDPHYGVASRFSFADIQLGTKISLDNILIISDNFNASLYGDLYLGTVGEKAIATGSNNIDLGIATNYKSLIVNLGMKINTGNYWKENGEFVVNSNYRDLSKFDQERIGTREILEQSEEEPIAKENPIYFGLGYLKAIGNRFAFFGELESEPMQNRYMVKGGANYAITDSRILVLVPFVGAGLTPHSEQYMFGLNFVGREGMFNSSKIDYREEGFGYMPSYVSYTEPVDYEEQPPARREITQYRIAVTGSVVNIRQASESTAAILTQATQGEMFDLIKEEGNWYNIKMPDGESAYIHNSVGMKLEYTTVAKQEAQKDMDRTVQRQEEQVDIERERSLIEQQRLDEERRREAQERQELTQQQQSQQQEERRQQEDERRRQREDQQAARRQAEALRHQQEEERRRQQVIEVENEKWRARSITRERHVGNALEDGKDGVTEAIRKIVTEGLASERDDVRKASYDALVEIGVDAIPLLDEGIRDNRYFVKRQVILILAEIGHEDAVPILERGYGDRAISRDVVEALRKIPGSESQAAYMRLTQMQNAESRMDSIRQAEEARKRQLFQSVGLNWGDTRDNLLTVAWRIAQHQRLPSPDAAQQREYQTLRQVFDIIIEKYNEALGEGAALRLLKDNGYDESVFEE